MSDIATVHTEQLGASDAVSRCQVLVVEGPDRGVAAELDGEAELVCGTGAGCGLKLSDGRVSRRHLSVRRSGARFVARDLGSSNGTRYEGSRIKEIEVGPGAAFKLGRTVLRIEPEPRPLQLPPSQSRRFGELVAESLAMREVFAVLELAAQSDVTVLVEGETGTGKELAARAVHDASSRRRGPFVAIDCGALPESLLESELFGHVRGAFTGASTSREGAFARADGGTLFLDELGTIPPSAQARLIRVLEERKVKPVGADRERAVDVRVVAASRHDLSERVAQGLFRSDLYWRLSVVRVVLPPLQSRREDLAPIVAEMMRRRGLEAGTVAGPNLDLLVTHAWPGNVRELRNVLERALALTPGARGFGELRIELSPQDSGAALSVRSDLPFAQAKKAVLEAFERSYLADLMARHSGNLSAAARAAKVDRKHLRELLRKRGQ
ncbi:MAG: sigma 54-interacting transcriptional regulator [Myxococcales bacterium]